MPISETCRVTGTAGNVGVVGAPILNFDLVVYGTSVSGQATITQALAPPSGEIVIDNLTGQVRELVFGGTVTVLVTLEGTYTVKGPPPTEYIILEQFRAYFILNTSWDGRGSFDYGSHIVKDVPVTSSRSCGPIIVPLYMAAMQEATAGGDLARMKQILAQAETHVANAPAVTAGIPALKAAIAKAGG